MTPLREKLQNAYKTVQDHQQCQNDYIDYAANALEKGLEEAGNLGAFRANIHQARSQAAFEKAKELEVPEREERWGG